MFPVFHHTNIHRWHVYPLKSEDQNVYALQDYTRTIGAPTVMKTDNAKSELGPTWVKHLREICTATETTEPHHPWQNPAERKIGALGVMVRNVMRAIRAHYRVTTTVKNGAVMFIIFWPTGNLDGDLLLNETKVSLQIFLAFVFIFGNRFGTTNPL